MPEEKVKQEVEKELTGRETEPWEIVYFELYKNQLPVVEQANRNDGSDAGQRQIPGLLSGIDLRRLPGAGANPENENREVLLQSALRFFKFLPGEERRTFLHQVAEQVS